MRESARALAGLEIVITQLQPIQAGCGEARLVEDPGRSPKDKSPVNGRRGTEMHEKRKAPSSESAHCDRPGTCLHRAEGAGEP